MLESMARNRYPDAERLKQIKEWGTLIALTYMLTLERSTSNFRKSRDAALAMWGCNLEGATRDRERAADAHSAKRAIRIYETLWCRLRIMFFGPGEPIVTLRRWGMKLAEHGGKRAAEETRSDRRRA